MDKDLIWYVCYGSNLCLERFMCYLTGNGSEKYGLLASADRKCKNPNPPLKSKVINIPYELYFARTSIKWENKGVCFLDPDTPSKTVGRAYLITKEQYEHVWKFEGPKYTRELKLEKIDGIDAVTFTSENRDVPDNKPSDLYYQVIFDGLIECGLTKKEAADYLNSRI